MFLEPYHAPYTFSHRYWTGLLLLVRAILYVISATNVSRDPGVDLLAVGLAMAGLLLLKAYSQGSRLYKKAFIDLLEMICYMNILLSCLAIFFSLTGKRNTNVISYTSASVIFVLLTCVVAYHMYKEFCSKCQRSLIIPSFTQRPCDGNKRTQVIKETSLDNPTHSEVGGPMESVSHTPDRSCQSTAAGHDGSTEFTDRKLICVANQHVESDLFDSDSLTTAYQQF